MAMEGVCRVCLAGDRNTYRIENTALEQTYDVVTGIKLQRAGRPTALCCVCVSQLRRCRRFIQTARESNDALDQWYQNHTHTDIKLSEQPLFTLNENQLFQISYDGALESGVKLEAVETDNGRINEDDHGTFLTEEIKYKVTFDYVQTDPEMFTHEEKDSTQTLNIKKDSKNMCDDNKDYTQFSSIKTENRINKCVWLPVTDATKLEQRRPISAGHHPSNTDTATTPRDQRIMFSCPQCSYTTSEKSHLKRHLMTHSGEKPFSCDQCDYKCTRKDNLKKHLMSHIGEIPFVCNKCDYKSTSKSDLKKHLMIHTGETPFMCDKCDFKCNRKNSLNMHLMTHTSEKPFACDKCDYKCRQKSNLKMHLLTHTGEKPFACDKCGFNCNLKKNLKIHLMTHTGEKPFMCDKCDYKCRQNNHLKKHLMIHTGEKPFACDKCDYKCSVKAKLKRHSITHDKNRTKNFRK